MRSVVIALAILLPLALTQDEPRFECPMEGEVITTPIITTVPGVASWEDCGKKVWKTAPTVVSGNIISF